ncbi:T9SS type A sorting domain-containing protein [Chitinophaga pendula]|uniref:T9SS type A sorting domain-containing protein n=1 Tax=Chitinophaga TaxID=79328 RepID=UPI000BAED8EA|nr:MULTISPECIES: T9SS type A sorting domain-containing protein [Chitinophaga]ASZ13077.1 hypothetical protein CK934_19990 [Chitinophaga sp. MD30]UCJ09302.1 T9SS type A sorting domain-containing protein [Chitinophaga pendula]
MKVIPILLGLLLQVTVTLHAQSISPGGIKAPFRWYIADTALMPAVFKAVGMASDSMPVLQDVSVKAGNLNGHPALFFAEKSKIRLPLDTHRLHEACYFTVYQSAHPSAEQVIWHTAKDERTGLVLTTSRMADLEDLRYLNYRDVVPQQAKVSAYIQHKNIDSIPPVRQYLEIGPRPSQPAIPVQSFTGMIPELVIYNRALADRELLRVNSYLCLKYGITLGEPDGIYLNSQEEKIWEGLSYPSYHHNVAGIIRDDSSGLHLRQSGSSNTPGLLTIRATDSLFNGYSLVWGDNDKLLVPAAPVAGIPTLLEKQWLMVQYGTTDTFHTDITLDAKAIDAPLPAKPVYWMVVDESGTGDFTLAATRYYRMSGISPQQVVHFKSIPWVKNKEGKVYFAFIAAGALLVSSHIKSPECQSGSSGSIRIKISGGTFPCRIRLKRDGGGVIAERDVYASEDLTIAGISAGQYQLEATDALRHRYTDVFAVSNQDSPVPGAVQSSYYLLPGQRQSVNAAEGMPAGLQYEWKGPNGFYAQRPDVQLTHAGLYTLKCGKDGCFHYKTVTIRTPPKNIFERILVYPNPSYDGDFNARLSLDKPANVVMQIFSGDGHLVKERRLDGYANYSFADHIDGSGLFYLTFRSGLSISTQQIIIQR